MDKEHEAVRKSYGAVSIAFRINPVAPLQNPFAPDLAAVEEFVPHLDLGGSLASYKCCVLNQPVARFGPIGMIYMEKGQKPILFVALTLSFILSLFWLQRKHDLSLPTSVDNITQAVTKPKSDAKQTAPSGSKQTKLPEASLQALQNETLGFETIYVINLPKRTDKLDAIRVAASVTGFNFEVIAAQNGADMSPKALPGPSSSPLPTIFLPPTTDPFAHSIVDNRLSSALIFEDDSDWDISFRSQLLNFATGSQWLLNTPADHVPHSPYGDDWDLLWLGHCALAPIETDPRRVVFENDPSTTPWIHRFNLGKIPDMTHYDNTTRIMYATDGGTCLYAYALSYRGAQKVLFHLSMSYYHEPVDFGMHDMCNDHSRNFRCIGVFPQMVDSHRGAGSSSKDSDISKGEEQVRKKGFSYNIVRSTRLNVGHLIDGEMDKIESQWPGEVPEMEGGVKISFRETFQD
ncbi:MAG: hypothetical protein LQ338_003487 [Usnochroma carphineum]|nr:MAG: hypothetical protein LQ338_003487 [Usnochroma carphineum]